MNDFDRAAKMIGNRFDLVMVASERMRELHRQRKDQEEKGLLSIEQRRNDNPPWSKTISDIENGVVGREYLGKIKLRSKKKIPKFEPL